MSRPLCPRFACGGLDGAGGENQQAGIRVQSELSLYLYDTVRHPRRIRYIASLSGSQHTWIMTAE